MKWMAAPLLLLWACTQVSPCEVRGGQCTRTDLECSATQTFIGFDSECGVNDKCCLPIPNTVDDGGVTCASRNGTCMVSGSTCATGFVVVQGSCTDSASDICCAAFSTDAGH
jgi:hypothetical protein